ncbi:energy transducer TonB [Tenacibaculum tangerinum]|uniref:Energy transducer TonB n=1 Tax=Tenacibaculum tangerinum TaxID=3038772 RepID=A0ABY8L0L6_9FLAO|nr:energy transducer TonB [Tenacibaculum tangerinum]WGH75007.1 energy transducer TonB [Tenacibaculum tangerinum]
MKKAITLLFISCSIHFLIAQEKCTSNSHELVDLNVIDKCSAEKVVETTKETPAMIAKVTSKRYLKKRTYFKEVQSIADYLKANHLKEVHKTSELELCSLKNISPVSKIASNNTVSFHVVDEIPEFLSCKGSFMSKAECFNYEMQKHILRTLVYPDEALEKGMEGAVKVSFVIDVNGKVINIEMEGNVDEILKEEAKRIVSLLPVFIPGKQQGKYTSVKYSFPMIFSLDSSVD